MAVVGNATEALDQRQFKERRDGSRWYQRVWNVTVDNKGDSKETVLAASGIPLPYYQYTTSTETDLAAVVTNRDGEQKPGHWKYWTVTVQYDSAATQNNEERQQNPLLWEPKIYSPGAEHFQVPIIGTLKDGEFDRDDPAFEDPMENSFGDPFDPQPMMEDSRPIVVIERNEVGYSMAREMEYTSAVNRDSWGGAKPGQVKLRSITTPGRQRVEVNNDVIYYYPVRYELAYKREFWDLWVLDQGYKYLDAGGKEHTDVVDGYPKMVKLDGTGKKLAAAADPVWLQKKHKKEATFALLNLPEQFP
jgi:hypothetical protein